MRDRVFMLGVVAMSALLTARAGAGVVEPHGTVAGHTLEDYSAQRWQYATSIPTPDNPLFDDTGAKAHGGQSGPVFFLVGKFSTDFVPGGPPVSATRNITVTDDKFLFFPVLNTIDAGDPVDTERQINADTVAAYTETHASVDGVAIADLSDHREISPLFSIDLPAENVFGVAGGGHFDDAAADGIYLMLEPLSLGQHVINFGGSQGKPTTTFALDVTYNVNVVSATAAIPLPAGARLGMTTLPVALILAWKSRRRQLLAAAN
jgi:hypothetical protein